jgi:hypothetical protein
MVVKFIKNAAGIGLAYVEGTTANHFTDAQANELIESGYAIELVSEETIETTQNTDIETAEKAVKKGKK